MILKPCSLRKDPEAELLAIMHSNESVGLTSSGAILWIGAPGEERASIVLAREIQACMTGYCNASAVKVLFPISLLQLVKVKFYQHRILRLGEGTLC